MAWPYVSWERPRPPYSRGILMPKAPISFSRSITRRGIRPVCSISSGSTSSRRKRSSFSRNGAALTSRPRRLASLRTFRRLLHSAPQDGIEQELVSAHHLSSVLHSRPDQLDPALAEAGFHDRRAAGHQLRAFGPAARHHLVRVPG